MLRRINAVHDARIVRIDDGKKFQSAYNKLLRAYRQLAAVGPNRNILTPQEQQLFDKQQHYDFHELSRQEQMKLKGEIDSMWGQIPEHLQKKARDLAGVN